MDDRECASPQDYVSSPVAQRFLFILRSIVAIIGGYLVVSAGTILTFNVLVGPVTIDSNPKQLILGTIGAVLSGMAGGVAAGLIAPQRRFAHAAGVLLLIAVDTAAVLAKEPGPARFDLAGSGILAISVLFGGWIIAKMARRRANDVGALSAVPPL
jgi:hypothetical protein